MCSLLNVARVRAWDEQAARFFLADRRRSPFFKGLFVLLGRFGPHLFFGEMGIIVILMALLDPRGVHLSLLVIFIAVVAAVATKIIIDTVARRFRRLRPFAAEGMQPLIKKSSSDPSFPSNHAGGALALTTVLTYFFPSLAVFTILLGLGVGFSRLYAGLHYPSDVLAGAMIGVGTGSIAILLYSLLVAVH